MNKNFVINVCVFGKRKGEAPTPALPLTKQRGQAKSLRNVLEAVLEDT